jgi:hypothetical protein
LSVAFLAGPFTGVAAVVRARVDADDVGILVRGRRVMEPEAHPASRIQACGGTGIDLR